MTDLRKYKRVPPNLNSWWKWDAQVVQYPVIGQPGISYKQEEFTEPELKGLKVDCILYRNENGILIGILNHYPQDIPGWEKAGNFNVFVDPTQQRKGIGKDLIKEALTRFNTTLEQQSWTPSGFLMLQSYLRTNQ